MPSLRAVPVEASTVVTGLVGIDVDNAGNKIEWQKVLLPVRVQGRVRLSWYPPQGTQARNR